MALQSKWHRQGLVLTGFAFFTILSSTAMLSCGNSGATPGANSVSTTDPAMVKKLFLAKCAICHGDDGRLGYNNSKDLTVSILTRDEIIALVKTGKNTMPPHENILSQEQIEALTDFTLQLRVKP